MTKAKMRGWCWAAAIVGLTMGCAGVPSGGNGTVINEINTPVGTYRSERTSTTHKVTVVLNREAADAFPCSTLEFRDERGNLLETHPIKGHTEISAPAGTTNSVIRLDSCGSSEEGSAVAATTLPFKPRWDSPAKSRRYVGIPQIDEISGDVWYDIVVKDPEDTSGDLAYAFAQNPSGAYLGEVKINGLVRFVPDTSTARFEAFFASEPEVWTVDLNGFPYGGMGFPNTVVQETGDGLWIAATTLEVADLLPLEEGNTAVLTMAHSGQEPVTVEHSLVVD